VREGDGGEDSNGDKKRAEHRLRSRWSPTNREASDDKKDAGDSAGGTGVLGIATSWSTCARHRARLRRAGLAHWRHDLATLRRYLGDALGLSCARRGLEAGAVARETRTMSDLPVPRHRPNCRTGPVKDWPTPAFCGPADCGRIDRENWVGRHAANALGAEIAYPPHPAVRITAIRQYGIMPQSTSLVGVSNHYRRSVWSSRTTRSCPSSSLLIRY
jgi:hypothetical protein